MNIEVVIIFYHTPMGWPDALFASALALMIGVCTAIFLWKLLTIED